jgi:hypothetical protein
MMIKWVLINKVSESIGYSDDAIRAKRSKGVWLENIHWRKAPDGRLVFNLEAIQKWMESKA